MYTTMRSIASSIFYYPEYSGKLFLYVADRSRESVYAVAEQGTVRSQWSDDVLYLMDWAFLQSALTRELPQNILCFNAGDRLERPAIPPRHNILMLSGSITADDLRELLQSVNAGPEEADFAPCLLEALYSGSAERLCQAAASLCCNPVFFLSFNFRIISSALMGSRRPELVSAVNDGLFSGDLVRYLHDKQVLSRMGNGEFMQLPNSDLRFLCVPILRAGIHIASILLFEDRVALADSDRVLLNHVAKCFRMLSPDLNAPGPTRLIYEYTLVRALQDECDTPLGDVTRFNTIGYHFKQNLYMLVVDHAVQTDVNTLRQQLNTLTGHIRRIVGNNGLCTSFRDHVIVLLNLENDAPLHTLFTDFQLFCTRNQLRLGVSPCFSDISQLKRHYRYALDAIGVGTIIHPDQVIYNFTDLRIYKFIAICSRSFSPTDLIPDYLTDLIRYDHENNSDLLETLYYYVYTVKNTKRAAELMHVHRNTLLYRLEKINSIIKVDMEDGDVFLQLMLSFKFLEFRALQTGKELCFKPIRTDPTQIPPEE